MRCGTRRQKYGIENMTKKCKILKKVTQQEEKQVGCMK